MKRGDAMRASVTGLCAATMLMLSACASSSAQEDVPALVVNPTPASRAELASTVANALGTASVTLADDALTKDSTLVVDRKPARDAAGQRLSGRDYGRPEQFQLVMSGRECVLIHQRTGMRYPLASATCTPA